MQHGVVKRGFGGGRRKAMNRDFAGRHACATFFLVLSSFVPRAPFNKILLLILTCGGFALAQQRTTAALGTVTSTSLPFTPSLAVLMHYNADPFPDVLCFDEASQHLVVLVNKGDGISFDCVSLGSSTDVTFLAAKDLNGDGKDDIVIVHRQTSQVEVWLSTPSDTVFRIAKYSVNFYPEKVLLADIDNDSTTDILCFGKLSSGISVLLGNKDGTFREKTLILPEIPVVDASVVKLNDDDFPDLVVHNWLTNEMVFYYGMGDLQFAEQNIVSFDKDTVAVVFGDFNRDHVLDYAVASQSARSLRFFAGDGMASYFQYQSLDFNHATGELMSASISSHLSPDIIAVDDVGGTFSVFSNQGDGTFYDDVVFGCTSGNRITLVGDIDNDGWNDVLVIDPAQRMMTCFWNARRKLAAPRENAVLSGEISFAVGKTPLGLVVGDFNNDGYDDVAVVDSASSSLSLLYGSPAGRVSGQIGVPTVEHPTAIRLYSRNDTSVSFLLTHESIAKVSVLTFSQAKQPAARKSAVSYTYAIATAESPRVFLPDAALQNKSIEFYVLSSSKLRSLSYFRQVSGTKFVERNIKPIIPERILAGSVNDFNSDGLPDLAYIYFDSQTLHYTLGITFSDSAGQYRGKTLSYVFPDSAMKRCYMTFADVNGDNIPDCILYTAPMNNIRIALGKGAGRFGEFTSVAENIEVVDPEHIQVVDFDGDGINDIMVLDDKASELFFLKGKGNGKFLPPTFLMDMPHQAMFKFGDFNGDGALDIVYSNPAENLVTFYFVNRK
jgi:hypothetical protein